MKTFKIICFLLIFYLPTTASNVNGWTSNGFGSTDVSEPSNWSLGHPPMPGEDVVIPTHPSFGDFFPVVDVEGINMNNLMIETGASFNSNGFTVTIGGNLTGEGTFIAGESSVTVSGNMDIASIDAGESIFNFDGPPVQFVNNYSFHDVIVLNEVTFTGDVQVNGDITINGVVNLGTFVYDFNGDVKGSGVLVAGIASIIDIAGNMTVNDFAPNSSEVTFNGTGPQSFNSYMFNSLIINSSSTVSSADNASVLNNLSITKGELKAAGSKTFSVLGNIIGDGRLTLDASAAMSVAGNMTVEFFTAGNSSTMEFNGAAAQAFDDYTFYHLRINNSTDDEVTMNGTTNVDGDLDIAAGKLNTNDNTLNVDFDIKGSGELIGGDGNKIFVGDDFIVSKFVPNTSGVVFNGSSQSTSGLTFYDLSCGFQSTTTLTFLTNVTVKNNLIIIGSCKATVNDNETLIVEGNILGSGELASNPNSTIELKGNLESTNLTHSGNSTDFVLNGASTQSVDGNIFNTLLIDNPTSVTLNGESTIRIELIIDQGEFKIQNYDLYVGYGGISGTGTLSAGVGNTISVWGDITLNDFNASSSTVLLDGSEEQFIAGLTFNNLTIDNLADVKLLDGATVLGITKIMQGSLYTNGNTLYLGNTGSLSGETDSRYVRGSVNVVKNLGVDSSSFGNIGLEISSGADDLGEVSITRVSNATAFTNNTGESINRYWEIDSENHPASGRDITFYWNQADNNSNVDLTIAKVYKSTDQGSIWQSVSESKDASQLNITADSITSFSIFTVSDESFQNPLNAPQLSNIELTGLKFIEGSTSIIITDSLQITDTDDENLESAQIQIIENYNETQDQLDFSDQNGIAGSWDSNTGLLSLEGTASIENYQSAIRSINFSNSSAELSTLMRRISITVFDGEYNSNSSKRYIKIYLSTPTNLTAEAVEGAINLSWVDNSSLEDGYIIERSQNDSLWVQLVELASSEESYSDQSIQNSILYKYRVQAVDSNTVSEYSDIAEATGITDVNAEDEIPTDFVLKQNYPNPFNPATTIEFGIPNQSDVLLSIYNLLGEKIISYEYSNLMAGYHTVNWNASGFSSGLYIYTLKATSSSNYARNIVKKMILLK